MSKVFSKATAALSVVLVLCLMACMLPGGIAIQSVSAEGAWDGVSVEKPLLAEGFNGGTGYSSNPYWITNAAQLAWVAQNYTSAEGLPYDAAGNKGYQVKFAYFKLMSDIDLGGYDWTPIGTGSASSNIRLDGNGKKIYGLKVNTTGENAGLFGKVGNGYTSIAIKNLEIVDGSVTGGNYTGGIIGWANGSDGGTSSITLENCKYSGTVNGLYGTGGLVGMAMGSVNMTNCHTKNATVTSGGNASGGLIGLTLGNLNNINISISESSSDATLTANGWGTGGLIGAVQSKATLTIDKSFSTGTIATSGYKWGHGGLIGHVRCVGGTNVATMSSTTITNCYSRMTNTATTHEKTGGLVGGIADGDTGSTVHLENCHFAGRHKTNPVAYLLSGKSNITATNVYYRADSYTNGTVASYNVTPSNPGNEPANQTSSAFTDGSVTKLLGNAWATSTAGVPVLSDMGAAINNALTAEGAAVRTVAPTGLRLCFNLDRDAATVTQYGIMLNKASNIDPATFHLNNTVSTTVNTGNLVGKLNTDAFAATLINITNYETDYSARAYAMYTDSKGQNLVVYSDVITSDLSAVAAQAVADVDADYSEDELKTLNSFVK